MEKKWKCNDCPDGPCILIDCDGAGRQSVQCAYVSRSCEWQQEDDDMEPDPELMTGIEAIVKAVNQGGGEVWHRDDDAHRITVDKDGKAIAGELAGISTRQKFYTVRPLPPETFDFTEAMARLMKGEAVYMSNGVEVRPAFACKGEGSLISIAEMKNHTFHAVPKST